MRFSRKGCSDTVPSMRLLQLVLVAALVAAAPPPPREVNLTSDSAPGWLPTVEQEAQAIAAMQSFFTARDEGRSAQAYALLTTENQQTRSAADFGGAMASIVEALGRFEAGKVVKVTWTKDSARAPRPGIYAAIDITARYAKAKRYCGYAVMYQASAAEPFRVMRFEENYLADAVANAATSPGEVERAWQALAANCPNTAG